MTEGEIDRKNEHAHSSQSVLESQGVKNYSFSCKISTNYEQPRQSAARNQIVGERAERLLVPAVYSLRRIRAYDELQNLL